jgi:hypothetical protein
MLEAAVVVIWVSPMNAPASSHPMFRFSQHHFDWL